MATWSQTQNWRNHSWKSPHSLLPLGGYLPTHLSGRPLIGGALTPAPAKSTAPPRESTESTDPVRTLELQFQLRRLEIEEQAQQAKREDR